MTPDRPPIDWRRPFHWWGPPWTRPNPCSLDDLVASAMLTSAHAAWLRAHVRSGGSVLIAAQPSGAGKSTLGYALTAEIPRGRKPVYVRGAYETFEWESTDCEQIIILVNEISDHLPIYAWSAVARRCLQLAGRGAQIIATAHAQSADDLLALLCQPPVSASPEGIAALDVVVYLQMLPTPTGIVRTVRSIARWTVDPDSRQPILEPIDI